MGTNRDVSMGEYEIGRHDEILTAMGIGSCVGVCLIDEENERGGLAHVMLPAEEGEDSSKHADVLLNSLVNEMKVKGTEISSMKAKIYGGASMFDNSFHIGERNVESVKDELHKRDIDIVDEGTGGDSGRAIWLNCQTGNVVVRKSFEGNTQR